MKPNTDEDIHEDLQGVSKGIQDVGRFVGSKRIELDELVGMSDVLEQYAETIRVYAEIQANRNSS